MVPKSGKIKTNNIPKEDKGLTSKSRDVNSMLDSLKLFLFVDILSIIIKYSDENPSEFITTYNESLAEKIKK